MILTALVCCDSIDWTVFPFTDETLAIRPDPSVSV